MKAYKTFQLLSALVSASLFGALWAPWFTPAVMGAAPNHREPNHSDNTSSQGSIMETLYFRGSPSERQIDTWTSMPPKTSFLIQMEDPAGYQLESLLKLTHHHLLRVEVSRFPRADTLEAWRKLAERGTQLIAMEALPAPLPTNEEIDRLNEIHFSKITFVLKGFPRLEEAERLARLRTKDLSITFATPRFPYHPDEEGKAIVMIPSHVSLLWVGDYWPGKWHSLFIRSLPHTIRLRVKNAMPSEAAIKEIAEWTQLEELVLDYDSDVPTTLWQKLRDSLPKATLHWISRNWIPSEKALNALAHVKTSTGSIALTLDSDRALTEREKARIQSLPISSSWTHEAP